MTCDADLDPTPMTHARAAGPAGRRRFLAVATAAAATLPAWPAWAVADSDAALRKAIDSDTRPAADRARDIHRHPEASMQFWGLKPGTTVIDVLPGGGWWTEILAPYLAQTGGRYIAATGSDRERSGFETKFKAKPALYGKIDVVGFGPTSGPLAPANSADLVLVSREVHNWVGDGLIDKAFRDFHTVLKPGGVLAIEDHRAPPGADPAKDNGYIPEAYVIAHAERAGFKLAARSEINANPKDTKDHPFGVWTLPPSRRTSASGPADPNFDRSKYDAIGESDRMTLKFVKPA